MLEIVPTLLAVLGTAVITAAAWFSKRATREGRLLLRIERLGAAYALLPESVEKKQLGGHLLRTAAALNDWLDVDAQRLRRVQWIATVVAFVLAVVASSYVVPAIASPGAQWLTSFAIGLGLGFLVLLTMLAGQFVLARSARQRELARAAERYAAFARGEKHED